VGNGASFTIVVKKQRAQPNVIERSSLRSVVANL